MVPEKLRKDRYRNAREAYLDGRIDEEELERRIEDALVGRIPYESLLTLEALMMPPTSADAETRLYGVVIEPGDTVVPEEIPDLFEDDPFSWC